MEGKPGGPLPVPCTLWRTFSSSLSPFGLSMNRPFQDLASSFSDEHCGVFAVDWDLKVWRMILRQMKVRTGIFGECATWSPASSTDLCCTPWGRLGKQQGKE